jgi:DNA-binding response OmpR family regulator
VKKILVVEDDRSVQKALKRIFESEDYLVEVTNDGKAGLDAFRSSPPSAVVLDLRLPGMAGNDVCREIKKEAPSLPVIILSAKADVMDKVLLLELGADDYVTKPFSPRVFPLISQRWKSLAAGSRYRSRHRNSSF